MDNINIIEYKKDIEKRLKIKIPHKKKYDSHFVEVGDGKYEYIIFHNQHSICFEMTKNNYMVWIWYDTTNKRRDCLRFKMKADCPDVYREIIKFVINKSEDRMFKRDIEHMMGISKEYLATEPCRMNDFYGGKQEK